MKKEFIPVIVSLLIIFFGVYLAGGLLKIMHWPGATALRCIGIVCALAVLVGCVVLILWKNKGKNKPPKNP